MLLRTRCFAYVRDHRSTISNLLSYRHSFACVPILNLLKNGSIAFDRLRFMLMKVRSVKLYVWWILVIVAELVFGIYVIVNVD